MPTPAHTRTFNISLVPHRTVDVRIMRIFISTMATVYFEYVARTTPAKLAKRTYHDEHVKQNGSVCFSSITYFKKTNVIVFLDHMFSTKTIRNCMQLKLRHCFIKINGLPNVVNYNSYRKYTTTIQINIVNVDVL